MDETAATKKPDWPPKAAATGERTEDSRGGGEYPGYDGECDGEAWSTLSRSFRQAQTVLDVNRALIEEVNSNHESKIPDNMAKNVGLIRQISGNISKVLTIYSDLSSSFSSIVRQQSDAATVSGKNRGGVEDGRAEDSAERVPEKSE